MQSLATIVVTLIDLATTVGQSDKGPSAVTRPGPFGPEGIDAGVVPLWISSWHRIGIDLATNLK